MQHGVLIGLGAVDAVLDSPYEDYLKSLVATRAPRQKNAPIDEA
jgi:hypothetical protein